ncbi:OmpA family protein [Fibrella forsythiae]|uniref:OmpA family protein n=1 Tax=Fibrella forsythiae TaxID=2817061 RepID=A0ABS3JHZ6_9BACT|nr:OmpA family protein [Fibrella forsythiae]MBO0949623.1 OmpA family protein [Fibrella forsythiae]
MIRLSYLRLSWLSLAILLSGTATAQTSNDLSATFNSLLGKGVVNRWIKNEPITTSIRDADKRIDLNDSFGNDQTFRPIHRRPRSATGGYILTPGFYELRSRSYCIRAGTHAPSNGDGYLYAPLLGRQKDIVATVLAESARHSEIDQHQVQLLLWAIIARSDFSTMNSELVGVATTLLTPSQLLRLNKQALMGIALSLIDSPEITASLRSIFSAEHQIRELIGQAQSSFQDIEQLAMLAGPALVDNPDVRRGRWSKHPDGYYIRYFPAGYSRTVVQLYVPEGLSTVELDFTDDVAVPANTGAQRLALSNVPYDTTGYAPEEHPVMAQQSKTVPAVIPISPTPKPSVVAPVPTPQYQRICGLVVDADKRTAITGATLTVGSQQLVTDREGRFSLLNLTAGRYISLITEAPNYMPDSLETEIKRLSDCQSLVVYLKPVPVLRTSASVVLGNTPMREGDRIVLENIQFEQSRSDLLPAGRAELDKVVAWMQSHETVTIELSGHTSNEGSRNLNLTLSKARAAACKSYLIRQGIEAGRTKTAGYGPDQPIVSNDSPEKAKNRRVELKIEHL